MVKYYDFIINNEIFNIIQNELKNVDSNDRFFIRSLELNAIQYVDDNEGTVVPTLDKDGLYVLGHKYLLVKDTEIYYSFNLYN